ncbi:hypothetical protein [Salinarimonas chemoclinalis]|uniref:hypothetical protein n=1 Tax=Salinarimonas chemoclinalis TaxID=3241599 RepID=UPI003555D3DF
MTGSSSSTRAARLAGVALIALALGAGLAPRSAAAQAVAPQIVQQPPPQVLPPERVEVPEVVLGRFLSRAHPLLERATWSSVAWDGGPLAVRLPSDHPLGDGTGGDVQRIAPDLTASGLSLSIGWRGTRLAAANAALVGEHLVLEGFTLENEAGTLGADLVVLSDEALRSLGAAATGVLPEAPAPSDVVIEDVAIEIRRGVDDPARGSFASRFSAEHLVLDGLVARTVEAGEDAPGIPTLDIAGFGARGVSGSARFAGAAEFTLGSLALEGSPRNLTRVAQAALGLADAPEDAARLFSLAFEDLLFRARRPGAEPAVFVAESGGVYVNLGSSASRARLDLRGARASATLLAGTPIEEQARTIAASASAQGLDAAGLEGGPHLGLDVAADAVLRPGRLRLRLVCLDAPGLADATAELDLDVAEDLDLSALGSRDLARARARTMSLAVVDHGLADLVRTLAGRSMSEIAGDVAASVVAEVAGLPEAVARLTTAPLVGAVRTLEEEGSLAASSPTAAPVPLAAAGLLASAGTAEPDDLGVCGR